ncbi:MAG: hypothetical protein Q9214_001553 [Letrouitia sp. 1 TL-2023]
MLRSYAVTLASLLSLSVALPQAAKPSELSALDCQDLSSDPAPECWSKLNMPAWITHWISIQTVCDDGESWSGCFLRATFGAGTNYDCSKLSSASCIEPSLQNVNIKYISAAQYYGAYNIYLLNKYLSNWAQALSDKSADTAIQNYILANQVTYPQLLVSLLLKYGNNDVVATHFNQSLAQVQSSAPVSPQTPITEVHQALNSQLSDVLNAAMTDFDSDVFLTMTAQGALMVLPAEDPAYLEGEFKATNPGIVPSG